MAKLTKRIDLFLVEEGYFESREQAQRAIMAGEVMADGKRIEKSSQVVTPTVAITLSGRGDNYVSRGAHKLLKAIDAFGIEMNGKVCLDAGASTGGFTDVMLQHGARLVYAVDVGYGQLAWKLRQDPRVKVYERQNIRYFNLEKDAEPPSLITADLSFISLELILAKFRELIAAEGELLTLIKPQFEAGREKVGKKGVVREAKTHLEVIERLAEHGPDYGWYLKQLTYSPIKGPEGNIEYLGHWSLNPVINQIVIAEIVEDAWQQLNR